MIAELGDPSAERRQQAVTRLGAFASPRATQALQRALHDEDPLVRLMAAEALCRLTPSTAGRLIAEATVKFTQPDLARTLLRLTLDHTVVPPLREALDRADQEWRRLVASGNETEIDRKPNPAAPIIEALRRISDPQAAPDLLGILEQFASYRRDLVEILTGLGEGIKPLLQERMERASGPFRQALLEIQTRLGLPLAPDLAADALENDNEEVRRAASAALVAQGGENARKALLAAFERDFSRLQAAKARNDFNFYDLEPLVVERADALGRLGEPSVLPVLQQALEYPSPRLQGFLEMVIHGLQTKSS